MEISEKLFEKWRGIMVRLYGFENPTDAEVREFASDLTKYFEVILEDSLITKK